MGILGSSLGRGLAGAGAAVADIANKYIDQALAAQRAQLLADIQRNSAVQQTKDIDAYQNDPGRRALLRTESGKDTAAAAEGALAADRTRATDPTLRQAAKDVLSDRAQAETEAEISRGNNPLYLKAKSNEAKATHIESAASLAQASLARFQMGVAQKTQDLREKLADAVRRGDDKEEAALRAQLDAFADKGGKKEKFYAIAEKAGAAISAALKSANDPNADENTKREAMATVRQQRALMERAAKDAGVDISDAAKVPEAEVHKQAADAIKGGADPAAINKRLVEQGYKALPDAGGKPGAAAVPAAPKVSKDWVGPGWSYAGKSYATKEEADAAMAGGAPAPTTAAPTGTSLFDRAAQQVKTTLGEGVGATEEESLLRQAIHTERRGGPKLTPQQRQRAQQLGLL
jgi:hypothetical protein